MAERDALMDAGVSEREAEVLELVAERATNAEIAARLFVSVRTVESHVSSLLRKLDVPDRRALARLAHTFAPAGAASGAGRAGDASSDYDTGGTSDGPGSEPSTDAGVGSRSLPVPLTSFVGRTTEVADLVDAVGTARLVTALGPGGVGKTRLATAVAAAVADRWRDGVWFVDLVPVTDEALVPAAVSRTLGLTDSPGRSSEDHVLAHLADRRALLVLDNCEHLVDGVGVFVERLLGRCPGVTVLATSQARLLLPFEQVFAVPGLSLPGDAGQGDAVSLFVERAVQAGSTPPSPADLERIGSVCRRLDGSALAIELAAARLPSLGLDGIERGLGERFDLLSGGSRIDVRHSSLRSTIDWSYALLDPVDQVLLRRVSVFAGPFTATAATTVTWPLTGLPDGDGSAPVAPAAVGAAPEAAVAAGLARLTEHSLLVTAPGPVTRHRVLDSIRQYGQARMAEVRLDHGGEPAPGVAPDELTRIRKRHHAWATAEMRELDRRADIPLAEALGQVAGFAAWRQDFDRVADDARAAVRWAHHADWRDGTYELAHLLASTTFTRGLLGESQRRYEQAAEHAPSPHVAAEVLMEAAGAASSRHVGNDALRLWRAAATTAAEAGDGGTAAYALARAAELLLRGPGIIADKPPEGTHRELIAEARALGADDPRARAAIETAVTFDLEEAEPAAIVAARQAVASAEAIDDPLLLSASLDALTAVDLGIGDLEGALEASRRRSELIAGMRASALSAFEVGDGFHMASEVALAAGDFAGARRYAEMSDHLSFHAEEGHLATSRLLKVDAMAGRMALVLENAERFLRGWEEAGRPVASNLASGSYSIAMAYGLMDDDDARAEWLEVTQTLGLDLEGLHGCATGFAPVMDALVHLHRGEPDAAVGRLAVEPTDLRTWYTGEWRTWYAALHVEAAVLARHPDAAARLDRARPIATPNPIVVAMLDRADALLAGDRARLVTVARDLEDSGCPYQWARTLVLAGGEAAEQGRRALASLGVAPMAEG